MTDDRIPSDPPEQSDEHRLDGPLEPEQGEAGIAEASTDAEAAVTAASVDDVEVSPAPPAFFGTGGPTYAQQGRARTLRLTVWIVAGLAVVGLIALALSLALRPQKVAVPTITGLTVPVARSRLAQYGLQLRVTGRRFSTSVPEGDISDQRPRPGGLVDKDGTVDVLVSSGVETFALLDVTGMQVDEAQQKLKSRGLFAEVQRVESTKTAGLVLSQIPSGGSFVSTADVIRLAVSAGAATDTLLLPRDLRGKSFVIDPEPWGRLGPDIPLEVSRRLRSLLEASGATVTVTRSAIDSATADSTRIKRAFETSRTALVCIDVAEGGPGGFAVGTLPRNQPTPKAYALSLQLRRAITNALGNAGLGTGAPDPIPSPILLASPVPGVCVSLGSLADSGDVRAFSDPTWADVTARALYRALAAVFRPVATAPAVGQNTTAPVQP